MFQDYSCHGVLSYILFTDVCHRIFPFQWAAVDSTMPAYLLELLSFQYSEEIHFHTGKKQAGLQVKASGVAGIRNG